MGIAALRELASIETIPYTELDNSVIAVDTNNWLYRYLSIIVRYRDESIYTTTDGREVPNLLGIIQGLPKFLENGLFPVFVYDGMVLGMKESEMEDRKERRQQASDRASELRERGLEVEAKRYEARAQRLTPVIQDTTEELIELLGIPSVHAPAEAEAQAAFMARSGTVSHVGTEDYDSLLFGSPLTLRKLTTNDDPELIDLSATLETHGITREQLVDIAILCGTDYNDGIRGYGPKTSLKAIREHGRLEPFLKEEEIQIENLTELRELFLDPQVTDNYTIEPSIDPDLDQVREYVCDRWEIPFDDLETAFERLERSLPFRIRER